MPTRFSKILDKSHTIVVLGPTAGGKSELAVWLAERMDGEVLGADSMQVYRDLNAATAKPSVEQLNRVPHHLINIVEPDASFTVADWLARCETTLADLKTRQKVPIVVGGTNLYIRAFLEGLFDGPAGDQAFRDSLDPFTPQELHRRLKDIDPASYERIKPADRKRIIRALEVHHLTGQTLSEAQQQWSDEKDASYLHNPILIGLRYTPEQINPRINARVKGMFSPEDGSMGLIEETQTLIEQGRMGEQAAKALGTAQAVDYLNGKLKLEKAIEQTKIQTRRFAKSQRTWLKRFRGVQWIDAAEMDAEAMSDKALALIEDVLSDKLD